ncbi:hypothetical protein BXZ70DRAFT_914299 [Cristinia sonorae]|uniref:Uncharacterized protein n=1 Tax=Cristinia sonorae TaxID=1940300 RepID=A0A8K0V0D2_9AGAR|nr:hypothetical protein BXZ70DRAFT_914299 [Cristinia sonorae]
MLPSIPRLVRILPRSQLKTELPIPARLVPEPHRSDAKRATLIELLQQRKEQAGTAWPANLRIEPVVPKQALKKVSPETRKELLELMRER